MDSVRLRTLFIREADGAGCSLLALLNCHIFIRLGTYSSCHGLLFGWGMFECCNQSSNIIKFLSQCTIPHFFMRDTNPAHVCHLENKTSVRDNTWKDANIVFLCDDLSLNTQKMLICLWWLKEEWPNTVLSGGLSMEIIHRQHPEKDAGRHVSPRNEMADCQP